MRNLSSLIVACLFFAGTANAQNFGIQLGGNLASAKTTYSSGGLSLTQNYKSKFGLIVGAVAEFPLASSISLRPELNFIQKGGKYTDEDGGTETVTLNYLEIPFNFVYNADAGSGSAFFGLGPSLGMGLSGKSVYAYQSLSETYNIKFDGKSNNTSTDDYYHLKGIDLGLGLIAGYKMENGVYFNMGYSIGLSNSSPDAETTYKGSGFSIKFGYMFSGNSGK